MDIEKRWSGYVLAARFAVGRATLGVLGGSGAGKSLLLRCVAGIERPTRGTIALDDRRWYDAQAHIHLPSRVRRVGFVFQQYALFPHLTVRENVAYGLAGRSKVEVAQRVEAQLRRLRLDGLGDRYPRQLSGGQQQRVALARALAPSPDVLLLDEPLAALDTHLRHEVERELHQVLAEFPGVAIWVSHNLEEIYRVCEPLLVLDRGQVVAAGPKQTVFAQPGSVTVARLTGCQNFSRVQPLGEHTLRAIDWDCVLQTAEPVTTCQRWVGLRAHHVGLGAPGSANGFLAWVAGTRETPYRQTVFLKLGCPPLHAGDSHLQAEVDKEQWVRWQDRPQPWWVVLPPDRLLLLREEA